MVRCLLCALTILTNTLVCGTPLLKVGNPVLSISIVRDIASTPLCNRTGLVRLMNSKSAEKNNQYRLTNKILKITYEEESALGA